MTTDLKNEDARPYNRVETANTLFRSLNSDPALAKSAAKEAVVAVIRAMAKAEGGLSKLGITPEKWNEVVGSPFQGLN